MENQVAAGAEVTATDAAVVSAEIPQKKKRKPINQQKLQDNLWGWAFCLPLIVGTVLFIYIALVVSLLLSFTNYCSSQGGLWDFLATMFSGGKPINGDSVFDMSWISGDFSDGGKNDPFFWYRFAFTEKLWSASLWQANNTTVVDGVFVGQTVNAMGATMFNTVFYLIGIPIGMVLAMFFAVCMSRDIKGGNVFRVLYYIPCVASSISIIYTFKIMFKTEGVINQILGTSLPWMMDGANGEYAWSPSIDTYWSQGLLSKTMIVIMSVWKGLGGTIILYVAGLSGVNAATKEAASIDGSSPIRTFFTVVMPISKTVYATVFILDFVAHWNDFMWPFLVMTGENKRTIQLAIQVIINIAVVTNSMPSTGIPLPLISYGGTSAIIIMAEMGIVLGVSRQIKQK